MCQARDVRTLHSGPDEWQQLTCWLARRVLFRAPSQGLSHFAEARPSVPKYATRRFVSTTAPPLSPLQGRLPQRLAGLTCPQVIPRPPGLRALPSVILVARPEQLLAYVAGRCLALHGSPGGAVLDGLQPRRRACRRGTQLFRTEAVDLEVHLAQDGLGQG